MEGNGSANGNGRHGATLAELAEAKRLPVDFLAGLGLTELRGRVRIPYFAADGQPVACRHRGTVDDWLDAKDRSRWPGDQADYPYGLWKLPEARRIGHLYLLDCEADCWALWYLGIPALALPGPKTAQSLLAEHLAGIGKIYVHRGPGSAGEGFVLAVAARLRALACEAKAFEISCPALDGGADSPAALYAAAPEKFPYDMECVVRACKELSLPAKEKPRIAFGDKYKIEGGAICRKKIMPGTWEEYAEPLCNFVAEITDELIRDNGVERARYFVVEGRIAGGKFLPRTEVPAKDFRSMNWVIPAWGSAAVPGADQGANSHLGAAIQLLSGEVPVREVFEHTGWRKVSGVWHYLHGAGAIGPSGARRIAARLGNGGGVITEDAVALPDALAGFRLPEPPGGDDLAAAVRASLGMLTGGLVRGDAAVPLWASVWRAALGGCDFGIMLYGTTGVFKSELAALAQQHYGAGLSRTHLPAGWESTANALEGLAFAAKDALMVVDDFAPTGSPSDVARAHQLFDRLLRGQGNQSGRHRMYADTRLRAGRPSRALLVTTAEDLPRRQSLRARLLTLEIAAGEVDVAALSECQSAAGGGLYAAAFAGFCSWLARRYDEVHGGLRRELDGIRREAVGAGTHARTPEIVANLTLGVRYALRFAFEAGAVGKTERDDLTAWTWEMLGAAASAQASLQAESNPALRFVRLLAAVLSGGTGHLAAADGGAPDDAERWGWRRQTFGGGGFTRSDWQAQGPRIGWLDEGEVYLEPEAAVAAVQDLARSQGDPITVDRRSLLRSLKERGLLISSANDQHLLARRTFATAGRKYVLHLNGSALSVEARPPQKGGDTLSELGQGVLPGQENGSCKND